MVPCPKNTAGYVFYVSLVSQASTLIFQANPTLAAADFNIAKDDGAPAALATTPVVDADFTKRVKIALSQAETNCDNFTIIFSDAAGDEWCDLTINIQTAAQTLDATDVASECTDALNAYDPPTKTEMDSGHALLATPTNITAGTIATATNLTNAPTAGDLTATMKASVGTAVETQLTGANTELAAIPTTVSGLRAMMQYLFQQFRNKTTMNKDTGVETLYKEDAATPLGTRTHTDDATTWTKGEAG